MKQLIVSLSVATALCSFASSSALAQMKVGIVDMNKVFTSYYKTKDAEARLNDARAQAKTDLDGRLETLKSNMEAATDPMQKSFAGLMYGITSGDPIDMKETLKAFPLTLTSVQDFARAALGKA